VVLQRRQRSATGCSVADWSDDYVEQLRVVLKQLAVVGRHWIKFGAVLTKADSFKGFQPHSATSGVRLKYSRTEMN
ncbi:MAG: hypothetical protein ABI180_13110, partial [Microcoleus sp.]